MVKDETVAIIIDEAHNLEIEVMEDLFRLCSQESPAAKLVQILLVGIVPRKVSSRHTWFRVFAGEFATRQECLETIRALRQQGLLPAFGRSS